jgi:hypothetical protein
MAFSSNPQILRDGLILNLDAADVTSRRTINSVEVMVVGGGGGGGMDIGGGGGGGGVLYDPTYKVTPGIGVTVTVGAGGFGAPAGNGGYRTDGAGPQPNFHQFTISATNGSDSVFGNLTAKGGGYGGSSYYGYTPNYGLGASGGNGGGASGYTAGATVVGASGTPGQGFKGGNSGGGDYCSGGGGGAGGEGIGAGTRADGGPGVIIPRMSPYYYGGGGGGAGHSINGGYGGAGGGGGGGAWNGNGGLGDTRSRNNGVNGGNGTYTPGGNGGANTGGGGGGGTHYNVNNKGGEGGSGIVIIRYNGPQAASGGTYTFENGVSYHTFTSSGTFTPFNVDTTWYDTSGFGHNATLHGGCSFSTIKGVPAITLDGTNDWIGNTTLTGGWSDFTLELMFYHNGLDQGSSYGVLSMGANGNYGPMFYCHNDCMGSHYFPGSPSGDYPGGMGYWSNNTWNIFTWVFKNTVTDNTTGDFKTYINGVYNSGTSNFNFHNGGMGRGSNGYALGTYSGGGAVYKGSFAIFRVYNRELSAAEVARNYSLIKTRFGL